MCLVLMAAWPCTRVPVRPIVGGAPVAATAVALDEETVAAAEHFGDGFPAEDERGVYAVIEIPAGTTGKFEVDDDDGWLHWKHDRETGARRAIDYLAFPVSYGMVPRTLAEDGDALDIVVLGASIERGRVTPTRVIGVLEMGDVDDEGRVTEHDDKLIAVPLEDDLVCGFSRLNELDELDDDYPNAREILALWFASYWGVGRTHVLGWGDAAAAREVLEHGKQAYGADRAARATRTADAFTAARSGQLAGAALRPRASSRSDVLAR